jgi:hypothetical protein
VGGTIVTIRSVRSVLSVHPGALKVVRSSSSPIW